MSTVNAPSARWNHKAFWTGSEMIVWGGTDQTNYLRTGARYNPTTDTWTPTQVPNATIPGRVGHTAVWTGSEMIVWGAWMKRSTVPTPEGDTIRSLIAGSRPTSPTRPRREAHTRGCGPATK